ncbi:prolipoprotein diacylglyceryl transferase [Acaryochloris sp. CCMEE 5410]|uniref:prolipoprotein diacylglyceryl transferase n=1 Tax=Acaryochloris sp. CCMEE 5410 TaxID=310037 RepID=UPI0021D0C239|nr:prolipoprotein diacylglyceryl transferase [Acaryochloris sp. CCMEE 5410]
MCPPILCPISMGYYSQHLDQVATIWRGGIAIHGAILGGMLAAMFFSRLNQIFLAISRLGCSILDLGQAIGRWGNFFNSEAFGDPTDLPWKLFIPPVRRPLAYRSSAYFHPTFLYESVWNLMVLGILLALFFKFPKAKKGTIFLVYAVTYSLGRLWIEGLRTDSLMLGPLRIAQVVSLIGIGIGMLGLSWLYLLKRSLPDTKQAS